MHEDVLSLFQTGLVEDFARIMAKAFHDEAERRHPLIEVKRVDEPEARETETEETPEPEAKPAAHDFKPGDRVRYHGNNIAYGPVPSRVGSTGSVYYLRPSTDAVFVHWDGDEYPHPGAYSAWNFEPLPPSEDPKLKQEEKVAEPEPTPQPERKFKPGDEVDFIAYGGIVVGYNDDGRVVYQSRVSQVEVVRDEKDLSLRGRSHCPIYTPPADRKFKRGQRVIFDGEECEIVCLLPKEGGHNQYLVQNVFGRVSSEDEFDLSPTERTAQTESEK